MPGIPASVSTQSPTVKHLAQVYYDKLAVENFKANTPGLDLCDMRPMPKRAGRTLQTFGYTPFGPSTAKAADGLTGQGLPLTSITAQLYLDQFVDYLSFSDVVVDTAIDPIVQFGAKELGYRGALTVNQIVFNMFDASVGLDSKVPIDLVDNEFVNGGHIRRAAQSLDAADVRRRSGGVYGCAIHPLAVYDLVQDNTAGGITDVVKRGDEGISMLQDGVKNYQAMTWSGVKLVTTTKVSTFANFPSAGKTGYATYVVGHEAFIYSTLNNSAVPRNKDFQVDVSYFSQATAENPALQTKAAVAYNFLFGVGPRPNTNGAMAYRRLRHEVAIV